MCQWFLGGGRVHVHLAQVPNPVVPPLFACMLFAHAMFVLVCHEMRGFDTL